MADAAGWFDTLPVLVHFSDLADTASYQPAPGDWVVCATDTVGSTRAIAEGRYKAVNLAGASAISALMNALPSIRFPFAFGGDGSVAVVPPGAAADAEAALAATIRFCEEELGLGLRAAIVPVETVRESGHDIRVARLRAARTASFAMFAGGGLAWVDAELKAGRYRVREAPAGARPDLTGLSCRWAPLRPRSGDIVSVVVEPVADPPGEDYWRLILQLEALVERMPRAGHPVPVEGPRFRWPPRGLDLEARASHGSGSVAAARRRILIQALVGWLLDRLGLGLGRFDPRHYRLITACNTDFRKFADGLRLTIECPAVTRDAIAGILDEARGAGVARYGLVVQDEAVMTCIVPSYLHDDHLHFVDGAGGGYAAAAAQIKEGRT